MRFGLVLVGCVTLMGCGSERNMEAATTEALSTMDVAEPPPPGVVARPAAERRDAPAPLAVGVPQVAYSYEYSFRLAGGRIAAAQDAHVALCDRLGPTRCQVLARSTETGDSAEAKGALKLRVAAADARAFGVRMQRTVAQAGGRALNRSVVAEDVSKDLVDAEARIRQRSLLVERLTEILRTRQGKVAELVEAERSVAAAQEEIDQARAWLAELRARVAMSTIEASYEAVAASVEEPADGLGEAAARSWSGFVTGVIAVARLLILLAPWALIAGAGWLVWRRVGPRLGVPRTVPDAS